MVKITTVAHVPPELLKDWLQHLRNFDTNHPGCHFQVLADAPGVTNAEIFAVLEQLDPPLDLQLYSRLRRSP